MLAQLKILINRKPFLKWIRKTQKWQICFPPFFWALTPCIPLCHHYLFSSPLTCIITAIATPPLMPPLPTLLTSLLPHCHHHTTIIGPHGVSLWKSISRGWPYFVRHIQFEVGAGFTVRFWQDIWCGDTSLCMLYPRLFSLSWNKEAYMADLMKFPNGVLFWDLNFRRYNVGWNWNPFTV